MKPIERAKIRESTRDALLFEHGLDREDLVVGAVEAETASTAWVTIMLRVTRPVTHKRFTCPTCSQVGGGFLGIEGSTLRRCAICLAAVVPQRKKKAKPRKKKAKP